MWRKGSYFMSVFIYIYVYFCLFKDMNYCVLRIPVIIYYVLKRWAWAIRV